LSKAQSSKPGCEQTALATSQRLQPYPELTNLTCRP
jgi:hypothetical protein